MKYWEKILSHFSRRGYFENGLTLPFLIGAYQYTGNTNRFLTVKEIIIDFSSQLSTVKVQVLFCNKIQEYVFSLLDTETEKMILNYSRGFKIFGNLVCVDGSFDDCDNLDQVFNILIDRYQNLIKEDRYSINFGLWGDFSNDDKVRLKEIIF